MKYKTIILSSAFVALLIANRTQAQNSQLSQGQSQKDSVAAVTLKETQVQDARNESRMADAKRGREQTKAKATNAQRIENDANAAARESRYAVRSERRAQKARKQANKQAVKAAKARDKSDRN